ncbi:cuticle protein CP14.6-like [Pararge aegeria]|uniref:Jg9525 protein n=1 Tax=Pararge aegeria aegeria TaxID=348720 RepID=A0A8S4RH46_9NEOP|nr:cuticle protein CP14.6-like [Pararge aegeria]CAH2237033.1 jg9525 [Pararge aegeria aegeria]
MKSIVFVFLAIGLLDAVRSEDDGKYRPELYGDVSGKYSASNDGRYYNYNSYVGRNYYPNSYAYQPQYYNSLKPHQELLAPLATQRASSYVPFVVTSTAAPAVVSTAKYVYTKNYNNEGYARIVEQENDINENSYQYKYRTENGISAAETGVVDATNSQGGTRVQGFYEYIGDDGLTYRVDYVADENGYRASGAHLPKA